MVRPQAPQWLRFPWAITQRTPFGFSWTWASGAGAAERARFLLCRRCLALLKPPWQLDDPHLIAGHLRGGDLHVTPPRRVAACILIDFQRISIPGPHPGIPGR